jgi:hypothetical protein|tara:strand:+ start:79 stop:324 length:246 start_codon:yes stop_codon:yes gene_type:complete
MLTLIMKTNQPKEDKMKTYRIEVEALKLIDVEATSPKEAKEKARKEGLAFETTSTENWSEDISANYHYEECDFDKAEVHEF